VPPWWACQVLESKAVVAALDECGKIKECLAEADTKLWKTHSLKFANMHQACIKGYERHSTRISKPATCMHHACNMHATCIQHHSTCIQHASETRLNIHQFQYPTMHQNFKWFILMKWLAHHMRWDMARCCCSGLSVWTVGCCRGWDGLGRKKLREIGDARWDVEESCLVISAMVQHLWSVLRRNPNSSFILKSSAVLYQQKGVRSGVCSCNGYHLFVARLCLGERTNMSFHLALYGELLCLYLGYHRFASHLVADSAWGDPQIIQNSC